MYSTVSHYLVLFVFVPGTAWWPGQVAIFSEALLWQPQGRSCNCDNTPLWCGMSGDFSFSRKNIIGSRILTTNRTNKTKKWIWLMVPLPFCLFKCFPSVCLKPLDTKRETSTSSSDSLIIFWELQSKTQQNTKSSECSVYQETFSELWNWSAWLVNESLIGDPNCFVPTSSWCLARS